MKLKNIIAARKVISAYSNQKVSFALAYKMMKFIKSSDKEEDFYNEKVKEIIGKYADKDENGKFIPQKDGGVSVPKDKIADCNAELNDVGGLDVDEPQIKFTLDEIAELKFSAVDLYSLDEFIIEGENNG